MIFGKTDESGDTKGVIRIRKWPNDQGKRPNNDKQNIKHKNKRSSNIRTFQVVSIHDYLSINKKLQ